MILGQLIRNFREHNKVSVRKLASIIGVHYSSLFRFEQGEAIDTKSWSKIFMWVLSENNNNKGKTNGT